MGGGIPAAAPAGTGTSAEGGVDIAEVGIEDGEEGRSARWFTVESPFPLGSMLQAPWTVKMQLLLLGPHVTSQPKSYLCSQPSRLLDGAVLHPKVNMTHALSSPTSAARRSSLHVRPIGTCVLDAMLMRGREKKQ